MGMFDEKEYLTGKDGKGFVDVGEEFFLHNAAVAGQVRNPSGDGTRTEVKLRVSLTGNPDDSRVVFTTAAAIVGQVERMDDKDRAALPIRVTLNTLPATQPGRNAAFILTLPGQTPESASVAAAAPTGDDDIPF